MSLPIVTSDATIRVITSQRVTSLGLQGEWDGSTDPEKNTFVDANESEILTFIDSPLTLGILETIVLNTEKNKLKVIFIRSVTITDLTGISLSFIVGLPKTILSVSGSGSETLVFTLNEEVSWGDLFDIDFSGTNIIDSESNNLGTISSTVDASEIKPLITSEATLDKWVVMEDPSLMFNSTGANPTDGQAVYEIIDRLDPIERKFSNLASVGNEPTFNASRGCLQFTNTQWLTTQNYNNTVNSGSQKFTAYTGNFHVFWKIECVTGNGIFLQAALGVLEGIRIPDALTTVTMATNTHSLRTFPTNSTKLIGGNIVMLEMVRFDGAGTIEFFVTDSGGSRESLGTVTDTGTYEGRTINNLISTIKEMFLYGFRSYSTDERANFESIHNEMNF